MLAAVSNGGDPRALEWVLKDGEDHGPQMTTSKAAKGGPLRFAASDLRADKQIMLAAVRSVSGALSLASEEMCGDLEVALAAVGQNGEVLDTVSDEMLGVREVVLLAVQTAPDVLQFAAAALQADREIVLTAVRGYGAALQDASDDLADDEEVVLAAVRNNGLALEFAGELAQANREVALAAVGQNPLAIQYVAEPLREDREIVSAAAGACPYDTAENIPIKQWAGPRLQKDEEFWRGVAVKMHLARQAAKGGGNVTRGPDGRPVPQLISTGKMERWQEQREVLALIEAFINKQLEPSPPTSTREEGGKDVSMRTEADLKLLQELKAHDGIAEGEQAEATEASWATVECFRPCALQLSNLPKSVELLSGLTLLWVHDNRLSDLPPVLPPRLTELCLHRNALTTLPEATFASLTSLKSLWLHSNRLTALPSSINKLTSLEELSLYDNCLSRLPESIGDLTSLRRLRLEKNDLTALPSEIGSLCRLEHIDVSNNRLTCLPRSIGKLQALSTLVVWANKLAALPSEICELRHLMALSASQNALVDLPERFGDMRDGLSLDLMDNPLQKPPLAVAARGVVAVRRYFEELSVREAAISRFAKLVLVGDGEVGKTSLLRLLQWRRAAPTAADDRTIQLDMSMLGVSEAPAKRGTAGPVAETLDEQWQGAPRRGGEESGSRNGASTDVEETASRVQLGEREASAVLFSCWDLSGQPEYAPAQQPFITCGPLFLLAVPAHRCHDAEYSAVLGRWLDVLQAGAPGAVVQPVVTQADRLLRADELKAAVERHVLRTAAHCTAGAPAALVTSGKVFYEVIVESIGSSCCIGWATQEFAAADAVQEDLGKQADSWCLNVSNGKLRHKRIERHSKAQQARPKLMEPYADGDVIGMAIDFGKGELWMARNDEWYVAFVVDPAVLVATGGLFPTFEGTGVVLSFNYGARPFVHGPPDSRFYKGVAPEMRPTRAEWYVKQRQQRCDDGHAQYIRVNGFCDQLRGKPEAFALTPMWRADVLREAAVDAVEWIRRRVSEHRDGYKKRCASSGAGAPPAALRVQRVIPVCSGVPGGEATGEDVRARLEAIACAKPPLLPSIGFAIPQSWVPAICFMRALRDGLPPGEATRRALEGLPPMDPRVDGTAERRHPYERVTALRELWEETLRSERSSSAAFGRVDVHVIDDVLSLLAAQGEVFLSAGVAYLEPSYVASLMKPLVDHTLSSRGHALGFALHPPHAARLLSAVDELVQSGVLREELLPILWRDAGLREGDYAAVLAMLEETGVLFRVTITDDGDDGGEDGKRWVMPMRLPKVKPVEIPSSWLHQLYRKREGEAAVSERCGLGLFVPPGLIERLLAACYRLGTHRRFWRTGCLLTLDATEKLSDCPARLIVDVESVAIAGAVPVASGVAVAGGVPVGAAEAVVSDEVVVAGRPAATQEGEVEEASRDYYVRFEAFGPPASEAKLSEAVRKAVELMRGLMKDFPGLLAPAAMAAVEREHGYAVC